MKTRFHARGLGLRIAALVTCLITAGTAYAATGPAAQETAAGSVTMAGAGGKQKVHYGQRLRLRGTVTTANRGVRLEYAPQGRGWQAVAQARTGPTGAYSFTVRARHSGAYRAVSDAGGTSVPKRVTVVARLAGRAAHHLKRGSRVRVRGMLKPGLRGRTVRLQLGTGHGWRTVDRARTGRGGRFRAAWRASAPGRFKLRVRFGGDRLNAAVSRPLRGRVYVYRPGLASWYGPGLYGNRTACGGTLGPGRLGVAHRTLPCGTRVTFRYRGRSVTVPVIDRGPFAAGRDWDLTTATKQRLGFGSTGTVWSTR